MIPLAYNHQQNVLGLFCGNVFHFHTVRLAANSVGMASTITWYRSLRQTSFALHMFFCVFVAYILALTKVFLVLGSHGGLVCWCVFKQVDCTFQSTAFVSPACFTVVKMFRNE